MDRLQKKCFVLSVGLHGLLLVLLVLGAGFISSSRPKPHSLPILDFIPAKIVEGLVAGGGSPTARPPPATPPPAPVQPEPQAQVQPKKIEVSKVDPPAPAPIPKPVVTEPLKEAKVPPKRWETKPEKPQIQPNLTPTVRSTKAASTQGKAQAEAAERKRAEAEQQASVRSALENLRGGLSSSTLVEIPGPGGEAYAGYSLVIQSIYQKAWIKPSEVADASSIVKVTVTIDKAGNVVSKKITKSSGNPVVDNSVQRTLDRVLKVPPFPEGSKDNQRIFDIDFNLTAKLLG